MTAFEWMLGIRPLGERPVTAKRKELRRSESTAARGLEQVPQREYSNCARGACHSGFAYIHRSNRRHAATRKRCVGSGTIGQVMLVEQQGETLDDVLYGPAIPALEGAET